MARKKHVLPVGTGERRDAGRHSPDRSFGARAWPAPRNCKQHVSTKISSVKRGRSAPRPLGARWVFGTDAASLRRTLRVFDAGAGEHCQLGNFSLAHGEMYDTLQSRVSKRSFQWSNNFVFPPPMTPSMNKTMVLGSPGAGKSTFAKRLGETLDRPVTHLDAHFWEPGWEMPDGDDWEDTHRSLIEQPQWILDGNYGSTIDARLDAADTVILLSVSRYVCLYRVVRRWLRNYGQTRPDMAEGCEEKIDVEFLRYVWNFPTDKIPPLESKLAQLDETTIVRLHSNEERDAFLDRLRDD